MILTKPSCLNQFTHVFTALHFRKLYLGLVNQCKVIKFPPQYGKCMAKLQTCINPSFLLFDVAVRCNEPNNLHVRYRYHDRPHRSTFFDRRCTSIVSMWFEQLSGKNRRIRSLWLWASGVSLTILFRLSSFFYLKFKDFMSKDKDQFNYVL